MFDKVGGIRDWLSSKSRSGWEKMLLSIIYHRYIHRNKRVSFILDPKLDKLLEPQAGERDWPGNPRLLANGWSNMMLLRYALAMHYSKGKTILDSCCGIGWGAYLLDAVALRTIAVDKDAHSLNAAKKLWPGNKTEYINASVLNLPFASWTFDLVTAMESVEHFSEDDINRYLCETARVLKPGGILIGSSMFPETSTEAESICAQNPHHLHINTRSEMIHRLQDCDFKQIKIFTNRLFFFARKEGGIH